MLISAFFFFKQKTAYELRISDWSSDVCSSDLGAERAFGDDALFEHRLALLFQRRGRVFVAGRELGRQFAQAAVELAALAAHAFERLRERSDLGALGLEGQRQCVRGLA